MKTKEEVEVKDVELNINKTLNDEYLPVAEGDDIFTALTSIGIDTSLESRIELANLNNITTTNKVQMNKMLLELLQEGKLKKL